MDSSIQPTPLFLQASSCVEKLQQLIRRTEKGLISHRTPKTQELLQGVQHVTNNSLRFLRDWITQFGKGLQANDPSDVATVASLFSRLHQGIEDALTALNSRLRYRRLLGIGFILHRRRRFEMHLSQALQDVNETIGMLHGNLKVVPVVSARQAARERRKTVILEGMSHTYNTFRDFFNDITIVDPDSLLPRVLEKLWAVFPYWNDLDGKVGNGEDPGDGLLYDDERVTKAQSILKDLELAWRTTDELADFPPPPQLPDMGKICLILTGMQQQWLLQDFLESSCTDQDLPLEKERLIEVLKRENLNYADTFATEQYRAVRREWKEGQHLEIVEGEPLPLIYEAPYGDGSFGRVYRVRDPFSGDRYARKDQKATTAQGAAAARKHLEEETKRLKDLDHRHIVQVVKTYQRGKNYGLLLKPAATANLQMLLGRYYSDKFYHVTGGNDSIWLRPLFLTAFGCLSHGLEHIHGRHIRHKDVKPANILYEKALRTNGNAARFLWADFGLAYDFSETNDSKTRSTKIYSPRYAAPEILAANLKATIKDQRTSVMSVGNLDNIVENCGEMVIGTGFVENEVDAHGRAADIFSLGCVFLELLAAIVKDELPLKKHHTQDQLDQKLMFGHNIPGLLVWADNWLQRLDSIEKGPELKPLFSLTSWMIKPKSNERPLVNEVVIKLAEAGPAYFCDACWKELKRQDSSPSKSSGKRWQANSPPSPTSPISSKASSVLILLKRVNSAGSIMSLKATPRQVSRLSPNRQTSTKIHD